jgi:hypothetical protein
VAGVGQVRGGPIAEGPAEEIELW